MNLTENESNDITKIIGKKFLINEWKDTTLQNVSGIYKIINKLNGKYYVGSANVISRRWRDHIHKLKKDTHSNKQNKMELATKWEMYTKYGIHPMYTRKLRSGKLKTIKGWTIKSA